MKKIFAVIFLCVVSLVACTAPDMSGQTVTIGASSAGESDQAFIPLSASIDAGQPKADFIAGPDGTQVHAVGIGDTFLGMELIKLSEDMANIYDSGGLSAIWKGEIILTGTLSIGVSEKYPDQYVTMNLDKESMGKLPFPVALLEFAPGGFIAEFSNTPEELVEMIGVEYGEAIPCEITISEYYISVGPTYHSHSLTMTGFSACAAPPVSSMSTVPPTLSDIDSTMPGSSAIDSGNEEWREETFTSAGKTITLRLPFYIHISPDSNDGVYIIFDEEHIPEGMPDPSAEIIGGYLGSIRLYSPGSEIPLDKVDEDTYSYQIFEHTLLYTRMDSICVDPPTFYELGEYFVYSDTVDLASTSFINRENGLYFDFLHDADTEELKTLFETIVLSAQVQ